jgi:hypothetical protein
VESSTAWLPSTDDTIRRTNERVERPYLSSSLDSHVIIVGVGGTRDFDGLADGSSGTLGAAMLPGGRETVLQ